MRYFEWDDEKAASNEIKHGVRFAEAVFAFDDEWQFSRMDREGEQQWETIGFARGKLLQVAHTVREEGLDEVVRIISTRHAESKERTWIGHDLSAYLKHCPLDRRRRFCAVAERPAGFRL